MRIAAACAAALVAALLGAGCFEGKGDFTINPDGSGKVALDITFPASPPWMAAASAAGAAAKGAPSSLFPSAAPARSATSSAAGASSAARTPEDDMKDACYKILKQSVGIEAWKNVSFERTGSGPIHFRATAYFKDLAQVKIYPDAEKTRMGCGPDGDALLLVLYKPAPGDEDLQPKAGLIIAPDDLAKQMKAERDAYRKAKGDLALEMSDLRLSLVFHVPGEPVEIKGLNMEEAALVMAVDGSRLLGSMDGPMSDNAWVRDRIFAGQTLGAKGTATLRDHFIKRALEYKGEAWARMRGELRTQFDYATEVDAAKEAYPDMLVKLGLEKAKPVRPAATGTSATTTAKTPAATPTGTARPTGAPAATPTGTRRPVTVFGPPTVVPKMPATPPSIPMLPPLP